MNKGNLYRNVKLITRVLTPRYYNSCSRVKQYLTQPTWYHWTSMKYITNYSSIQKKDSNSSTDQNESKKNQNILDDEEFMSILKDFKDDFGVDEESDKLLEDIRKNIDGNCAENKVSEENTRENSNYDSSSQILGSGLDFKYKEFSDVDSTVIPSYEEEQTYHIDQELKPKPFRNLERGVTGVFDIEDLIQVLRSENLLDIVTISMLTDDKDSSCNFFVLVTAKSARHIEAVAESMLKLYKKKKHKSDPFVTVQGTDDSGWKVIDMGNIILHIFLEEIRDKYDIESCQLFDLEYDSGGNVEKDPMLDVIAEQMEFFNSLKQQPNSTEISKDNN